VFRDDNKPYEVGHMPSLLWTILRYRWKSLSPDMWRYCVVILLVCYIIHCTWPYYVKVYEGVHKNSPFVLPSPHPLTLFI
jgi:hypothetical protein